MGFFPQNVIKNSQNKFRIALLEIVTDKVTMLSETSLYLSKYLSVLLSVVYYDENTILMILCVIPKKISINLYRNLIFY